MRKPCDASRSSWPRFQISSLASVGGWGRSDRSRLAVRIDGPDRGGKIEQKLLVIRRWRSDDDLSAESLAWHNEEVEVAEPVPVAVTRLVGDERVLPIAANNVGASLAVEGVITRTVIEMAVTIAFADGVVAKIADERVVAPAPRP